MWCAAPQDTADLLWSAAPKDTVDSYLFMMCSFTWNCWFLSLHDFAAPQEIANSYFYDVQLHKKLLIHISLWCAASQETADSYLFMMCSSIRNYWFLWCAASLCTAVFYMGMKGSSTRYHYILSMHDVQLRPKLLDTTCSTPLDTAVFYP
jgi:hypothetical protein